MKKMVIWSIVAAVAGAWAGPMVTDVQVTQAGNREVTVTYKLSGEPAVVTFDLITNCVNGTGSCPGASIGGQNLWYARGDVNRLVGRTFDFSNGAEKTCRISWTPNGTAIGESNFRAAPGSVRAVVKAWATNCPPDYMVVTLDAPEEAGTSGMRAEYYASVDFIPGGLKENPVYKETKMVMRKIPAAGITWRMGSTTASDGSDRNAEREIPHLVQLSYDYYLGVFAVTEGQYLTATDVNPSGHRNEANNLWLAMTDITPTMLRGAETSPISERPSPTSIIGVMSRNSGVRLDLPTEAEWEYAYRAGSGARYGRGDTGAALSGCTGYVNWGSDLAVAGSYRPNAWGVYDMGGGVWEFCLDYFVTGQEWFATFGGKGYDEPVVDPYVNTGMIGSSHVDRGGAYSSNLAAFRCAARSGAAYNYTAYMQGFRLRAPAVAE